MRKLFLVSIIMALLTGLMVASVSAAPYNYSASPGVAIPDGISGACLATTNGSVISTINVPDSFTINDLNLGLNISHDWVGDIRVTLTSPATTTVTLIDRPGTTDSSCGFGGQNITTTLDDESGNGSVENANPPTGSSYTPNNALSAFDGQNAFGTWTITVYDTGSTATGTLNSWSLVFDGSAVSGPPPSAVVKTVNEDPDGDGISGDRDNCPYDYNPDQEDGWGSKMGDLCDTEWYNTNGMGVSGFEGKDDMYQVFANCYPMYDGDTRCHLVGRFDPTTLSPDSAPMDVTNADADGWTVTVYYLHSNNGADVYQVNVYDQNGTLVDDRLEIHVNGGSWQWYHRGGDSQYNGI